MVVKQVAASISLALVILIIVVPTLLNGQIQVQIRPDARGEMLQSLNVTITEVSAHRAGLPEASGWVVISNETRTFDILKVANLTTDLAAGSLSLGRYDMLRLFITNATALVNGTKVRVELPTTVVDIPISFDSRLRIETVLLVKVTGELKKEEDRGIWSPTFNATLVKGP